MQIPENILQLIEKYQAGTASAEEKRLLNEWYYSFNDDTVEIDVTEKLTESELETRIKQSIFSTIHKDKKEEKPAFRRYRRFAAAAAILFAIAAGSYLFIVNRSSDRDKLITENRKPATQDVAPGGDKAVLTLVDGSQIILDSTSNGLITNQGNVQVKKLSNGQVVYLINGSEITENDAAFYNTISTPRGGQYQVTLADGTKVWLNAASSIRFPVLFTGRERNVEITGEAYLEVAKNREMPFKVKAGKSEVEVLGTHFNVNAYDDEPAIKTTLLEGLVKVTSKTAASAQTPVFLQPGQQSGINKEGRISVVKNADVEEALAWKNGRFQFNSADLRTMLRQISRWYDVDVIYKGNVDLHFTGQLTRNDNVSKVFEKLAMTGEVHFKIDGKKIIVTP